MSAAPHPQTQSTAGLILSALRTLVVGFATLGLLLFLPAGTLNYWQAWVLTAVFVLGSIAIGIYLSIHDSELLGGANRQALRRKPDRPKNLSSPS
jgi:hypothetical protein